MSKFNVGDVVRLNQNSYLRPLQGVVAVVYKAYEHSYYLLWSKDKNITGILFFERELDEHKGDNSNVIAHYYASQICGEVE